MISKMKLQAKLLVVGCLLTIIPLLIVSGVLFMQNRQMMGTVESESLRLSFADLTHIADSVYTLAESHQEVTEKNIRYSLNTARAVVEERGGIFFSEEKMSWNALNQYTKGSTVMELPKMLVGDTWFGQEKDPRTPVPVVDRVQELVGVTCTVFQRMNTAGDMLRVATNVIKKDGSRAIGTYIPSINPDGRPNPVISTVLKGGTFNGRAFVVNAWDITAYEPIYDVNKDIVGVLYVGIPQENVKSLREAIMNIKVGRTGYVYVMDSKGNYVISKDGKRNGENVWQAQDANGTFFMQEICKKALELQPREIDEQKYSWKNPGDSVARMKIVKVSYFKPWDWVIGVGSYLDEFQEADQKLESVKDRSNFIMLIVFVLSLLAAVLIWFYTARSIAGPINRIIGGISNGSEQVASASGQVSAASHALATGSSEQAASIEETSSSLEEMSSMTKQNADNAGQADTLMTAANQVIVHANQSMAELTMSMEEISKASEETSKIIKTIDEIAFQTNLLALNAAVEAARAGEAGAGFAVVADEVRNLSMRAADAASNTSDLIEGTVKKIKGGSELVTKTNEAFTEVATSGDKVGKLVAEIAAASKEQSQGIEQVNRAVAEMDKIVQQNAANAEESASASEQMNSQAEEMKEMVGELKDIVGNQKGKTSMETDSRLRRAGRKTEEVGSRRMSAIPNGKKPTIYPIKDVSPEKIIPMKEGDFTDI